MVNQRRGIVQEFRDAIPVTKSVANPSIFLWASRGKGVQGESTNSQDSNSKQIINKQRKPM